MFAAIDNGMPFSIAVLLGGVMGAVAWIAGCVITDILDYYDS